MAEIDLNYKFLKIEEMAKDVAEQALDNFLYDGKSIREWMQIIASEDCVSRQAAMDGFGLSEKTRKYGGDHSGYDTIMKYEIQDVLEDLPPVTPQPKTGHWCRKTKVDAYDIAGVKTWGIKCQCDRCDFATIVVEDFGYYKYCPNCGCRMVQERSEE